MILGAIGWPAAVIAVIVVIGLVALISTVVASNAGVAAEQAKGKHAEEYQRLASDYETLTRETRDAQATMQVDLAELRKKVDSIENMMREVS
jgi:hypothetical protein